MCVRVRVRVRVRACVCACAVVAFKLLAGCLVAGLTSGCVHIHVLLSYRTGATAATWSLQRLDALAAEVIDNLQQQHPQTIDSTWSLDEEEFRRSTQRSAKLHEKMRVLAHQYPMQVLMAVNGVLFGRHGYSACNRYGMPRQAHVVL